MIKTCTQCGEGKHLSLFPKNKTMKDGHLNQCKDCKREYKKKWYQQNAQEHIKTVKKWRDENRQEYLKSLRKWRTKNAESYRLIQSNSEAKRTALMKKNGAYKVTSKDLTRMKQQPCAFCGSTQDIQIDHVTPIAKGGVHGIGNLQPLCAKCNRSKHDKYMIQFKREKATWAT